MENMTLNPKEQARLQVLNSLLDEHMILDQAATLMGVTTRHTRRILAAYRDEGAAAVAHGHRGRQPVPRQLYLPVGVNQFCRFTSWAWPRCWAALVR